MADTGNRIIEIDDRKKARGLYRGVLALAVVLSVAFCALGSYLFLFKYDFALHYYETGLQATLYTVGLTVVSFGILFIGGILFGKRRRLLGEIKNSRFSIICSAITGFAFLCYFLFTLMNTIRGETALATEDTLGKIALGLSFFAAIYYITNAFLPIRSKISLWLAFPAIIWGFFQVMTMYYTRRLPINCQPHLVLMMAILVCLLYSINELRFRTNYERSGVYFGAGLAAVIICPAASLPFILKYITDSKYLHADILVSLVIFGTGLYIFSRLLTFAFAGKSAEAAPEEAKDEEPEPLDEGGTETE